MKTELLTQKNVELMVKKLAMTYKDAHYYLNFSTPIELVVAAILSAQTRDEVVNKTTPSLFAKYKSAQDYSKANEDELIYEIKSISFAANKAKNIIKTCTMICNQYSGKVPKSMQQLIELPGIGRKTANTILINAYGIVEGIPVDTWVIKLSKRLGLSDNDNPDKIEEDLKKKIAKEYWGKITYILKTHGKRICGTVPYCSKCPVNQICPKNGVTKRL